MTYKHIELKSVHLVHRLCNFKLRKFREDSGTTRIQLWNPI